MSVLILALIYIGNASGINGKPLPETILVANDWISWVFHVGFWFIMILGPCLFILHVILATIADKEEDQKKHRNDASTAIFNIIQGGIGCAAGILGTRLLTKAGTSDMLSLSEFNQTQLILGLILIIVPYFQKAKEYKP